MPKRGLRKGRRMWPRTCLFTWPKLFPLHHFPMTKSPFDSSIHNAKAKSFIFLASFMLTPDSCATKPPRSSLSAPRVRTGSPCTKPPTQAEFYRTLRRSMQKRVRGLHQFILLPTFWWDSTAFSKIQHPLKSYY